jgi:hypothetical protein
VAETRGGVQVCGSFIGVLRPRAQRWRGVSAEDGGRTWPPQVGFWKRAAASGFVAPAGDGGGSALLR